MPEFNPRTDRDLLTGQAYATDEHLAIRYRIHERYSRPQVDFQSWVLEAFNWRGDERVLDVGAGPGSYVERVRQRAANSHIVAGDLSFGMAQRARHNLALDHLSVANLDAQSLPFPDDTFDVVLANHMLYHVPNLDRALTEIRRVLRPDGCLIAASNSLKNMPEFSTLARRACTLLGCPISTYKSVVGDFGLENGTITLGRYFRAVARYDLPSAFHFPEAEPALAYLNSMRALAEPQLPESIAWADFMEQMAMQIGRLISYFGELRITKLSGVIVATNGGGFAREFLQMLDTPPA